MNNTSMSLTDKAGIILTITACVMVASNAPTTISRDQLRRIPYTSSGSILQDSPLIPSAETDFETIEKFQRLTTEWRSQRGLSSSAADMAMIPAYQKIIGMGQSAIPLIIDELKADRDDPDHWFWALAAILPDVNPVPAKSRGKVREMAKAWIKWGQEHNYA